jgi:MFS family permease
MYFWNLLHRRDSDPYEPVVRSLSKPRHEFREGWPVLLAAVIGSAVSLIGIAVFAFSFFLIPLQKEFGWERGKIGTAVSFLSLTLILSGPLAGRLCDRYGTRRVISVSIVLFSAALLALTQIRGSVGSLYVGYVVLGVVGAGATYGCYSRAIVTWFERNRGIALGLTASGPGIMAIIAPQVLPRLIGDYGWRIGWVFLAACALIALPLTLLLVRERPAQQKVNGSLATPLPGMQAGEVRRSRTFWTLAIGIFIAHSGISGVNIHLVAMLTDMGAANGTIKIAATIFGLSLASSRVITGFLLDRLRGPVVAAGIFLIAAVALLLTAAAGPAVAVVCAIGLGLVTGAEGDLIGYLVSRYFGIAAFTEIFGWLYSAFALGGTVGPLLTGVLYDRGGSYRIALVATATGCIIAAIMYGRLGPYPVFEVQPNIPGVRSNGDGIAP